MSVFIYTTLFIFRLFCNVFFNLKHKKCRHYSFRNSKWRQNGSFLTLVLEETQQLLRHNNINITMIYLHHIDRAKNTSEERIASAIF